MLHLALAALLATGSPVVDNGGDKDKDTPRDRAAIGLVAEEAPVIDTYAYGRSEPTFLQVWAGYGWGTVDERYDDAGNAVAGPDATVQRAFIGAQVNFINLQNLQIGVGGQFTMFSRDGEVATPAGTISGNSGFSPQQVKVYAEARGRVLGIHGGYIFDLGEAGSELTLAPGVTAPNPFEEVSDQRDAIFVGASFDYPATWLRLFGGVDYYWLQENTDLGPTGLNPTQRSAGSDLLVFTMGAGVRISWVEIGAAAIIHAQENLPGAGHHGSIAPYLRLSPPAIPASLSIRGAFNDEYGDYGYSLGGARKPVTHMGFTAALTFGF